MKNLFYILVLILGISSCAKNKTIKGRVYNPLTNIGIGDVEVQSRRKLMFCLRYDGCTPKRIDATNTDADGYFVLKYRNGKGVI